MTGARERAARARLLACWGAQETKGCTGRPRVETRPFCTRASADGAGALPLLDEAWLCNGGCFTRLLDEARLCADGNAAALCVWRRRGRLCGAASRCAGVGGWGGVSRGRLARHYCSALAAGATAEAEKGAVGLGMGLGLRAVAVVGVGWVAKERGGLGGLGLGG